jgi:hypothetical protein
VNARQCTRLPRVGGSADDKTLSLYQGMNQGKGKRQVNFKAPMK